MFVVVCFIVAGIAVLSWAWAKSFSDVRDSIDGSDFLNSAGRDGWDDNIIHSEGDF